VKVERDPDQALRSPSHPQRVRSAPARAPAWRLPERAARAGLAVTIAWGQVLGAQPACTPAPLGCQSVLEGHLLPASDCPVAPGLVQDSFELAGQSGQRIWIRFFYKDWGATSYAGRFQLIDPDGIVRKSINLIWVSRKQVSIGITVDKTGPWRIVVDNEDLPYTDLTYYLNLRCDRGDAAAPVGSEIPFPVPGMNGQTTPEAIAHDVRFEQGSFWTLWPHSSQPDMILYRISPAGTVEESVAVNDLQPVPCFYYLYGDELAIREGHLVAFSRIGGGLGCAEGPAWAGRLLDIDLTNLRPTPDIVGPGFASAWIVDTAKKYDRWLDLGFVSANRALVAYARDPSPLDPDPGSICDLALCQREVRGRIYDLAGNLVGSDFLIHQHGEEVWGAIQTRVLPIEGSADTTWVGWLAGDLHYRPYLNARQVRSDGSFATPAIRFGMPFDYDRVFERVEFNQWSVPYTSGPGGRLLSAAVGAHSTGYEFSVTRLYEPDGTPVGLPWMLDGGGEYASVSPPQGVSLRSVVWTGRVFVVLDYDTNEDLLRLDVLDSNGVPFGLPTVVTSIPGVQPLYLVPEDERHVWVLYDYEDGSPAGVYARRFEITAILFADGFESGGTSAWSAP
jgi:hypothetical protein